MYDPPVHLGTREIWGRRHRFGLDAEARRQHVYAIGKTGTGKSSLIFNMIVQDLEAGRGVGLIDPHGDLAESLLDAFPPWRADDLVYFDPSDTEYPVAFNLFAGVPQDARPQAASGIVAAFKHLWGDSWGPRLEYILYAAVAALLECENVSLLGLQRMLRDSEYRAWVLRQVHDPLVRAFWLEEFAAWSESLQAEAIAPVQNKVGQLLMTPPLRNILGQVKRKIDLRFMMDDQRVFIANLAKGRFGEDKANLLGTLLLSQFQLAAMTRSDLPESERADFFLYADEFHNHATEGFASALAESRKYGLSLLLAHQYLAQLPAGMQQAIDGNVGTLISFRVGETDAPVMARELPPYEPRHLSNLRNFEVCLKMMAGGEPGQPFTGLSSLPVPWDYGHGEILRNRSREKYATHRSVVEDRINRWLE